MKVDDTRYPQNTAETLYIPSGETIEYVIDRAKKHFGVDDISELTISAENIQIRCFGYDQYDGSDWRQYLVITR